MANANWEEGIANCRSSVAHTIYRGFDTEQAERLRERLQQNPHGFGKERSVWTLPILCR